MQVIFAFRDNFYIIARCSSTKQSLTKSTLQAKQYDKSRINARPGAWNFGKNLPYQQKAGFRFAVKDLTPLPSHIISTLLAVALE